MKRLLTLLGILFASAFGTGGVVFAQDNLSAGRPSNVEVTLLSQKSAVVAGETFYVALNQKIAENWHTYWRNPGDSGEPTVVTWTLPGGVTAGPIQWPTPTAIPFGPLTNYGYSRIAVFPVEIKVPPSAKVGETLNLIADVSWLECSDICIPGQARVAVDVVVATISQDSANADQIARARTVLPTQLRASARLTDLGAGGLQLVVTGMDTPSDAYFFPYEIKIGALVDFAAKQELVRGKDGFGLTLVKSPSFPNNLVGPVGGVLVIGTGSGTRAYALAASYEAPPPNPLSPNPAKAARELQPMAVTAQIGLLAAIGLAFLGGLILNLMPCVFPILSMKALGLLEAAHGDTRAARGHGLWYGAGVLASFLALGGLLIGLGAAGNAIGWGFQLQAPIIVIALAVLMVLIGYNLLGFFDIGTSLQGVGSNLARGNSGLSSFATGILAVVVAAPCTAPFMGAALGFAATQPPPIALLVFIALGFGFAAPFVALTFAPRLMQALPRPGAWMVRLREALAFPMFATAIWLIWVVSAQAGQVGVLAALVGVFGASLAVWIARTWSTVGGKLIAGLTLAAALAFAGFYVSSPVAQRPLAQSDADEGRWSTARVEQLQAQGKTVFVNFTADWCVTCKVNEVSVFNDARVKAVLGGENVEYLVADWTKRDDQIANALASHGRVGVPLYLVYKPEATTPQILPQLLSAQIVLDALK